MPSPLKPDVTSMVRPEIEAKARELIRKAIRDDPQEWAQISPAQVEMIVRAVVADLQDQADKDAEQP